MKWLYHESFAGNIRSASGAEKNRSHCKTKQKNKNIITSYSAGKIRKKKKSSNTMGE
jgi:hypothetical protein